MIVYLAGPVRGLSYEDATDWRGWVQHELAMYGIRTLSPMRNKEFLAGTVMKDGESDHFLDRTPAVIARDRFDVLRSDAVLLNLQGATEVSIGTCIEIGWADSARKPMVLIPGATHDHPWIHALAGFMVESMQEAIQCLRALR